MDYIEFFTEAINEYRIQNNLNISQFAERLGVSHLLLHLLDNLAVLGVASA